MTKQLIKIFLSILAAVLLVCLLLDLDLPKKLLYTEVLTVSEDIPAGTIITNEMLDITWVPATRENAIKKEDAYQYIGKESLSFLVCGETVFPADFDDPKLIIHPNADEYEFSIMAEWLLQEPTGIKRGNRLILFVDGKEFFSGYVLSTAKRSETGYSVTTYTVEEGEDVTKLIHDTFSPLSVKATKEEMQRVTSAAERGARFMIAWK